MRAYLTLDILTGLALVAIIASISLPSLSSLVSHLNLKKEAEKINYSLESMVIKASKEKQKYTLRLEPNGISAVSGANQQTLETVRILPKKYKLEFPKTNQEIHFYKQGTCSPSSFSITNGVKKCSFAVSLRCRASVNCAS